MVHHDASLAARSVQRRQRPCCTIVWRRPHGAAQQPHRLAPLVTRVYQQWKGYCLLRSAAVS